MRTDFLNPEHANAKRCECCGHFLAVVPDWRDNGGCLSKYWECPICFSLADEDFWKVISREKTLPEIVEGSGSWAPDTFAELHKLCVPVNEANAKLINSGFIPHFDKEHWLFCPTCGYIGQEYVSPVGDPSEKLCRCQSHLATYESRDAAEQAKREFSTV